MPARSPRQPILQPTRRSTRQSTRQPNSGSSAAPPSRDPLRALHDAEVYLVLEYLDPPDIVCAGAVCRQWKAYIDDYISTTAMRRSFPPAWDEHKHRLPLNRLELAREYRRQACGYHALRTGKATAGRRYSNVRLYDIREPYVAWSDGRVRFDVENLFSARAAWQGTDALHCSSTTTRLNPTVILTRIESLYLAPTLDLLFLRVAPQYSNGAHKKLQFVAEDLATGEELYRRNWEYEYFELRILKTHDLIVFIMCNTTFTTFAAIRTEARMKPATITTAAADAVEELQRMHCCVNYLPGHEVFQRNMRDRMSVACEDSPVALRQEWRIRVMREEAASAACACPKAADSLDNEAVGLVPLAPFEAATPPRLKRLSQYQVEHSALITLPPKSSPGSPGRKKANANDGPGPRRPFQREIGHPRALRCIYLSEHRMDFISLNCDLYILSFRAQ
ncbi:MAG: hypothetical protein M1826_003901 [Phylliscum demangeonii]|nr:MAG: hypothetical protein M1826_003901 [Phylliscum demangeonii]